MSWIAIPFSRADPWRHMGYQYTFSIGKAVPTEEAWRILHSLADAQRPLLLREVQAVLDAVGIALAAEDISVLMAAGDTATLEMVVRRIWDHVGSQGLQETLLPQMRTLALAAAEATSIATVGVRFNVQDTEALAAIEATAGAQIVAISETTLDAVRGIIQRAFESGTPLTQQIAEIRDLVGLTPRQAEQVARYRQGLVEAGESARRVEALVTQRADVLRTQRAENIARTESINAAGLGQHERTLQAVRDGLLDSTRVRRFWLVAQDERLCPICAAIPGRNPDGVGLTQPFDTPRGLLMMPAAHPQCRCAVNQTILP